jgi:hypothetical protein
MACPPTLPSPPLPHCAGANNTWWNIYATKAKGGGETKALALPPCSFGPLLTYVGNFGSPKGAATQLSAAHSMIAEGCMLACRLAGGCMTAPIDWLVTAAANACPACSPPPVAG